MEKSIKLTVVLTNEEFAELECTLLGSVYQDESRSILYNDSEIFRILTRNAELKRSVLLKLREASK